MLNVSLLLQKRTTQEEIIVLSGTCIEMAFIMETILWILTGFSAQQASSEKELLCFLVHA